MPSLPPQKYIKATILRGNSTIRVQAPLDQYGNVEVKTILNSVRLRLYKKDEIWILKKGSQAYRSKPYKSSSLLNERDHNDCTIFIGPKPPAQPQQLALPAPPAVVKTIPAHPASVPSGKQQQQSSAQQQAPAIPKKHQKKSRPAIKRKQALAHLRAKKILAQKDKKTC